MGAIKFKINDTIYTVPYFAKDGEEGVTVYNKYSELVAPAITPLAAILNDEVIPKTPFEFEEETEYYLFVNPQMPLTAAIEANLILTDTSDGYDDNTLNIKVDVMTHAHPFFAITAVKTGDTVTYYKWIYAAESIFVPAIGGIAAYTILAGWSYVVIEDGEVTTNETIKYTDLPDLTGTFTTGVSQITGLGGTYLFEDAYDLNKAGIYYYNEVVAQWVRNDKDSSLWCQATAPVASANGYNTQATATAASANGYNTQATAPVASANGYNTQATATAASANGYNTQATATAASANGYFTEASEFASFIAGAFGKTPAGALFSIGNGTSKDNMSTALDAYADLIDVKVPMSFTERYEYYGQNEDILFKNITNIVIFEDSREFKLPPAPDIGFVGKFDFLINVVAQNKVLTFDARVEWEDNTPFDFSAIGCYMITGFYNPFTNKWALTGRQYGLPTS